MLGNKGKEEKILGSFTICLGTQVAKSPKSLRGGIIYIERCFSFEDPWMIKYAHLIIVTSIIDIILKAIFLLKNECV